MYLLIPYHNPTKQGDGPDLNPLDGKVVYSLNDAVEWAPKLLQNHYDDVYVYEIVLGESPKLVNLQAPGNINKTCRLYKLAPPQLTNYVPQKLQEILGLSLVETTEIVKFNKSFETTTEQRRKLVQELEGLGFSITKSNNFDDKE